MYSASILFWNSLKIIFSVSLYEAYNISLHRTRGAGAPLAGELKRYTRNELPLGERLEYENSFRPAI